MKILVIHAGGTIGMVQTATGLKPELGIVEGWLHKLHQQGKIETDYDLLVANPLIDSANASPDDWNWIARTIADKYDRVDGFVVTHGTDTLSYTSSALCFALEGLGKPVILTGSMLPLSVQGNDGLRNLTDAMKSAYQAEPGIWVQFSGWLLHGARVRKSHSQAFDAFHASPTSIPPKNRADRFRTQEYSAFNVPVLAVTPGMSGDLAYYSAEKADGLILRCYGSGTLPENRELYSALNVAKERDIPVMAVSQCSEGGISLGTYAAGAVLKEVGVLDGRDATTEAAYTKLLYTLSKFGATEDGRSALAVSLCGEFS